MTKLIKGDYMGFSKKTFAVASLAAAISLAGCSNDNPDAGSSSVKTAVSGIAVDGYIAGATVYVDFNNNGRKNAGEPSALTDKDGYFTTAKDGITNYCGVDATSLQTIHCLKAAGISNNSVIRTFGGYDLFTGEPFKGSLAARVTVGEDGVVASQMVSPLTSMLVDISDADDQENLLDFFGLLRPDLETDFLDGDAYNSDTVKSATLLNSAIKLHKIVTLFSEVFSERYEAFGEERSFPETPNAIIYKALATNLVGNSLDQTTLTNAFNDAQSTIRVLYEGSKNLTLPSPVNGTTPVQNALSLIGLVDSTIPSSTAFSTAASRVIGVETVVQKMVKKTGDISDVVIEASDIGSGLYAAIDSALVDGDVDFIALTEVDYSALTSSSYDGVTVEGGNSFADLANKQLYVSLGESQNEPNGRGYFFFNSEDGATGGELKVCLKYSDGNSNTAKFEESDGVLLSGTWLSLDSSKLILKLSGALSVSLTDKGTSSNDKQRYTLSYGGETRSWLSDDGLLDDAEPQSVTDQPTNDAECASLLNTNNSNLF